MDMTIIGTKWVYRNKLDENGIITRNNARLVGQGYNQQEGINYDETYAPVARLESIRILLAYACVLDFKLYQMNVKSAFLNGFINEEVYVAQPTRFIDFAKPNYVYRLKKALYGLKEAPKAWYDRLKSFLIKHDYSMVMVDNTLFTKKKDSNLIIVQIYVDDIIFGSTCQEMCDDFAKIIHDEFEQTALAISTTEAEYVSVGKACQQALWMKQALVDYGVRRCGEKARKNGVQFWREALCLAQCFKEDDRARSKDIRAIKDKGLRSEVGGASKRARIFLWLL
nr:copia protein [Tanacetum cinerariifolium]